VRRSDAFEQAVLFVLDPQLAARAQGGVERGSGAEQLCSDSHVRAADRRFQMKLRAIERRTWRGSMVVQRQCLRVGSLKPAGRRVGPLRKYAAADGADSRSSEGTAQCIGPPIGHDDIVVRKEKKLALCVFHSPVQRERLSQLRLEHIPDWEGGPSSLDQPDERTSAVRRCIVDHNQLSGLGRRVG
jgi:hypothetical protein